MADSVQYALDRMVVDLDDLRYREIFSEAEVRAILAKRRDFEYMLQRHEARRLDYMRYVEYELNLESLRALRTKRIEGSSHSRSSSSRKKKNNKGKASTADFCCVRLVRWIFDRAVMKFPGDVDIWLHYIDFAARQGQSKTIGRLFARALQLHPRNAGLWIKAASWEFFDGGNASSARSLMQRALRINPTAQNLWLQYFRLEFSYVEKLMGRREILGLEEEEEAAAVGAAAAAEGGDDSGGREGMDIPELEAEKGGQTTGRPSFEAVKKAAAVAVGVRAGARAGGEGGARPAPVMNDTSRRFYKGAVPMAVFRAAIKAVSGDVGFRAGFLRCCAVDFPVLAGEAAQTVLASIEQDFPESCEAWELRASYPLLVAEAGGAVAGAAAGSGGGGDGLGPAGRKSVDVLERAVAAIGTSDPDMWVRYASFLRARLEACEERRDGGGGKKRKRSSAAVRASAAAPAAAAASLAGRLQEVLARAVKVHLAAPDPRSNVLSAADEEGVTNTTTTTTVMAAAIAARKERGGASQLATRGVSTSAGELKEMDERRGEDAREALSAGLADVCLALGKPEEALAALRAATAALPRRPGPWLRRAALERRLLALGTSPRTDGGADGEHRRLEKGSGSSRSTSSGSGGASDDADVAMATLRAGIKAVPATAPGYPSLWRELLTTLVAAPSGPITTTTTTTTGDGSENMTKKKPAAVAATAAAVAAAFRDAVEACNPSGSGGGGSGRGGEEQEDSALGGAQGEFLAGYIRWSAAVRGVGAARRVLRWARSSFLLSGAGAAVAYNEVIELERALDEVGETGTAGGRAKRIRGLFEDAADKFGKELPSIWEEYAQFEIQEGDVKRANAVRWRSQQP
ncbi:unnamed protein product [Pylaiella littoralis]